MISNRILDSRKEDLQFAYLSALCADADIDIERMTHDSDSVDAEIKKVIIIDGEKIRSSIQLQLKCSSSEHNCRVTKDNVTYDLPVKNYNDLRRKGLPILLMLLVLPSNENVVQLTEEELLIKGTMFFKNLIGNSPTTNTGTVAISFSKSENIVTKEKLLLLLEKAGKGEDL